jgi:hypothetical protein
MLRLAEVDAGRLAELMTDAWRMRAPAELATDFEAAGDLLARQRDDRDFNVEASGCTEDPVPPGVGTKSSG